MTPEQMRIAIAEACGAKRRMDLDYVLFAPMYVAGARVEVWEFNGAIIPADKFPDYFNNVSARQDAWKQLNDGQRYALRAMLIQIASERMIWFEEAEFDYWCEAYLRVVGKYVLDSEPSVK